MGSFFCPRSSNKKSYLRAADISACGSRIDFDKELMRHGETQIYSSHTDAAYQTISDVQSSENGDSCLERERRIKSHVVPALALLLLLVSVCMTSTLVLLSKKNFADQSFSAHQAAEQNLSAFACIACSKLLHDPSDIVANDALLKNLKVEVKDGKEECCAYNSDQITALFESIMRMNDIRNSPLPSLDASDFKISPVSAHKRIYPARIIRYFGVPEIPPEQQVCLFKPDDPKYGLEHHRGVEILNRGLRIQFGGLYYIYTSILFRPQSIRPCREFKYQTFTAYIQKISKQRAMSEELLKLSSTCCDICTNSQDVRFTGGVFVLQPGDVIRITVMGYELVHFNPYTTFAGLMILGTPQMDESTSKSVGDNATENLTSF